MESEREELHADAIFVGAGPACLSGAIHLMNLIETQNEKADLNPEEKRIEAPRIIVLEKGSDVGSHGISGFGLASRLMLS